MSVYEVWSDPEDNSVMLFPATARSTRRTLSPTARKLRLIVASSWDRAMTIHYELMGWDPYVPTN